MAVRVIAQYALVAAGLAGAIRSRRFRLESRPLDLEVAVPRSSTFRKLFRVAVAAGRPVHWT